MRVSVDEEALKEIARMTKAKYFHADNAKDLAKIYNTLNSRMVLKKKETGLAPLFDAAAAVFALLSATLSLFWFHRVL
jgi:Ca-activated chloride channel family protein